jgi:hypothetical protein
MFPLLIIPFPDMLPYKWSNLKQKFRHETAKAFKDHFPQ